MIKLRTFYRDVLTGLNSMIFEKHSDDYYDNCDLNIVNNEGIAQDKILVTDSASIFFIDKSKFPFDINAVNGRHRIESNAVVKKILDDCSYLHLHGIIGLDKENVLECHNRITNKDEERKLLIVEDIVNGQKSRLSMYIMKYFDLNKILIFGKGSNQPFVIMSKPKDLRDMQVEAIVMPVTI